MQPSSSDDIQEVSGGCPVPRSSAKDGVSVKVPIADHLPEEVSCTNSEFESVMSHRWRKKFLCHPAFSEQEFNTLNSIDAYLGAALTSLEGAANLLSASLQVSIWFRLSKHKL